MEKSIRDFQYSSGWKTVGRGDDYTEDQELKQKSGVKGIVSYEVKQKTGQTFGYNSIIYDWKALQELNDKIEKLIALINRQYDYIRELMDQISKPK